MFELTQEKAKIIGEFLTDVNSGRLCLKANPQEYAHLFVALGEGRKIKGPVNMDKIETVRFRYLPSDYSILPKTRPATIRDVQIGDFVTWPCLENHTYKILVLEVGEHRFKAAVVEHSAFPQFLGKTDFFHFNVSPGYRIFRKGIEIKEVNEN